MKNSQFIHFWIQNPLCYYLIFSLFFIVLMDIIYWLISCFCKKKKLIIKKWRNMWINKHSNMTNIVIYQSSPKKAVHKKTDRILSAEFCLLFCPVNRLFIFCYFAIYPDLQNPKFYSYPALCSRLQYNRAVHFCSIIFLKFCQQEITIFLF